MPTTPTPAPAAAQSDDLILLADSVDVAGAQEFGQPGFHEPVILTGTLPEGVSNGAGRLAVRLRDTSRPSQECNREHPLSGCVTVDWSDFEGRLGVPPGGVFDNRLTVASNDGSTNYFLSEQDGLAAQPDDYSPT